MDEVHDDSVERQRWFRPNIGLLTLFALALGVRALVASRTAMPDWDGVHFLWLADRAASSGDLGALFRSEFFHPGFPAVLGLVRWLLAPDADAFSVAQTVACLLSASAVFPLWSLAREVGGSRCAVLATLLFATGAWFARFAADGLSESLFHPLVAWTARILWRAGDRTPRGGSVSRAFVGGLLGGLAFAVRPEGAILVGLGMVWLAARGRRRAALSCAVGGACVFVGLAVAWRWFGGAWVLSPKFAFVYAEGVGSGGVGHYLREMVAVPGALLEGVGWLVVPLAVFALLDGRTRRRSDAWVLAVPLMVQCVVAPGLKAHFRFFAGFGILVLPLAAAGLVRLLEVFESRSRFGRRAWSGALLCILLLPDVVRWPQARRQDRVVERDIGRFLATRDAQMPGALFTDMTRVAYFAGCPPNPPRRWHPTEVAAAIANPAVRYLALVEGRLDLDESQLIASGFRRVELPPTLRVDAEARRATVWRRRERD